MMLIVNRTVEYSLEAEPYQIVENVDKHLAPIQDKLNLTC